MFMRDHPPAVNLSQAKCRTHPHVGIFSVFPRSANPVEAVGESHVSAQSDAQVPNLVANRTFERREPLLPIYPICICSPIFQWGREIEQQDVLRVVGHKPVDVFGADSLYPTIY